MFAEVHDQNLLHATLLKVVLLLSEEFHCSISAEIYYEYNWQPYQLFDKNIDNSIPQIQMKLLQEILLPHDDLKLLFYQVVWGHLLQKTDGIQLLIFVKKAWFCNLLSFTIWCVCIAEQKMSRLQSSKCMMHETSFGPQKKLKLCICV